jgi:hypothetical protein
VRGPSRRNTESTEKVYFDVGITFLYVDYVQDYGQEAGKSDGGPPGEKSQCNHGALAGHSWGDHGRDGRATFVRECRAFVAATVLVLVVGVGIVVQQVTRIAQATDGRATP